MIASAGARPCPWPALASTLVEGFGPKVFIPWELVVLRVGGEALLSIGNGSHRLAWWLLGESTSLETQLDGRATQPSLVLWQLVSSQPGSRAAASPGDAQGCRRCARSLCHKELLFSFAPSGYSGAPRQAPLAVGDTSTSIHPSH